MITRDKKGEKGLSEPIQMEDGEYVEKVNSTAKRLKRATNKTAFKRNVVKRASEVINESDFEIFESARRGVKPAFFYRLARNIKLSDKALADLINISPRTISNYKDKSRLLDPVQSEHLLKLSALYKKGEVTFGSIDEFNYWLRKPFWKSHETPFSWLITPGGVDLVNLEVERLAQGYPA
jgi:uncharacterized protein (DUF2384 family)